MTWTYERPPRYMVRTISWNIRQPALSPTVEICFDRPPVYPYSIHVENALREQLIVGRLPAVNGAVDLNRLDRSMSASVRYICLSGLTAGTR